MSTCKSKAKTNLQTEYWHQYQWREAGGWWRGEGCREGARQPACTGAMWVAGKARQGAETSHLSSARREHSPATAGGTPEHQVASVREHWDSPGCRQAGAPGIAAGCPRALLPRVTPGGSNPSAGKRSHPRELHKATRPGQGPCRDSSHPGAPGRTPPWPSCCLEGLA